VAEAVDELIAPLADPELIDDPLTLDLIAASVAGVLRGLLVDTDPRRALTGPTRALLAHVAQGAPTDRPGSAEALTAMTVYGGPLADPARSALDQLTPTDASSEAAGDVGAAAVAAVAGRATIERAYQVNYLTGEAFEIVLALEYPGRGDRPAYLCTFDAFDGPHLATVGYVDDITELLDELAGAGQLAEVSLVPVADALSTIDHALIELDDLVDEADLDDDDDLILHRPFLDHLVVSQDRSDVVLDIPKVDVDGTERRRLATELAERVRAEQPHLADTADALAPLIIDFAADRAGGPHRWPGSTVVRFLEMVSTGQMAPAEQLAQLPDLMWSVVTWAHEHLGWPAEITDDAHSAIEKVRPLVTAEIEGREVTDSEATQVLSHLVDGLDPDDPEAAQGLLELLSEATGLTGPDSVAVEPPAGGHHPEPFDGSGVPPDLADRATDIAELAAAAAADLFDDEFVTLVRRATADAARHPDRTLGRGRTDIWASGVVYAVAQINEIPGGWHGLALPADVLTDRLAGAPSTIAAKAREIRRLLGVEDRQRFGPTGRGPIRRYVHSASVVSFGLALETVFDGLSDGIDHQIGLEPGKGIDSGIDHGCFVLRAALADIRPEIWRRLRVPVDTTFAQLHELLQLTFGWTDSHLHQFDIDSVTIGPDRDVGFGDGPDADEDETELADLLVPGSELVYTYDFGDDWRHRIVVEELQLDGDDREHGPWALLGGAMAGPPEDCGGPWGYRELLKARTNRSHPRRGELADFLPPGFDPKRFDLTTLNGFVQRQGQHWDGG
jgi:hypothetical protein